MTTFICEGKAVIARNQRNQPEVTRISTVLGAYARALQQEGSWVGYEALSGVLSIRFCADMSGGTINAIKRELEGLEPYLAKKTMFRTVLDGKQGRFYVGTDDGGTEMTASELESIMLTLLCAVLEHDEGAREEAEERLLEAVNTVSTFQDVGVLCSNPGLRFQLRDGTNLHAEITY